jgi:hypothetical protein
MKGITMGKDLGGERDGIIAYECTFHSSNIKATYFVHNMDNIIILLVVVEFDIGIGLKCPELA